MLLLINGSLRGDHGNTAAALHLARKAYEGPVDELTLATYEGSVQALAERLQRASHLIIGTGTYWSSWGSPLQRFLEVMSSEEGKLLGKRAGVIVTMDSVGGLDVAQRLCGVLSLWGCAIAPMSMVVLSRAAQQDEDVWQPEDIATLVHNVTQDVPRSWPLTRTRTVQGKYPAAGPLDLGVPRFLPGRS